MVLYRAVEEKHHLSAWLLGEALADKVRLTNLNPSQLLSINCLDVVDNWVISGSDSETVDLISNLNMK